jgi:hypothetical protein
MTIYAKTMIANYNGSEVFTFMEMTKKPFHLYKINRSLSKRRKNNFLSLREKNKYDFMPVADLAEQIASVIMQDEILGIINCCTGNPKSLAEVVEDFIKYHNLNIKLNYGAYPDRPYDFSLHLRRQQKITAILRLSNKQD